MPNKSGKSAQLMKRRKFTAGLGLLGSAAMLRNPLALAAPGSVAGADLSTLDGRVVYQRDRQYESWRTAMPWQMYTANRKPDVIVRPNSVAGVVDAVRHAAAASLQIAIKSGGHNVSEAFLRDGGMLLDLGELQGIEVDAGKATAWVEPALWSDGMMKALAPHKLAFPVAHCGTVPMGGYLLGGGVGINGDQWGSVACHCILAAEVVTAQGEKVLASPTENSDLYWAVRGAGTGFFGVVTRYKLQLHRLPEAIRESTYIFPIGDLEAAVAMMVEIAAEGPEHTELMLLLAHSPVANAGTPVEQRKVCIARVVAFGDTEEESAKILRLAAEHPRAAKALVKNESQVTSFEEMAVGSVNAYAGLGFGRSAVDTVWTDEPLATLQAVTNHFLSCPSDKTHYVASFKIRPTLRPDAAFSRIGKAFVGAYAMWDEESGDDANFSWLAEAAGLMLPHAKGQYINEVDGFRDPGTIRRCFSSESWKRLRELRAKYDPEGRFYDYQGLS